jgi:aryl-alcohol dehydrogenase-like predicted oxidoreductase
LPDLRQIGRSGLATPRLVLGGNVFGWTAKGEEAFRILDRFADAGGRLIDTAEVYSAWVPGHQGGESESLIGAWLKRRGGAGEIRIATKVGMMPWASETRLDAARIQAAAEGSLKRLGVDAIHLYYAHQDDAETPLEVTLRAFDRLVKDGKVVAIAASNHGAERLAEALAISKREGLARYEAVQNEFHLMNGKRFDETLRKLCVDEEIGGLPFYGLASGFLTGKYRSSADFGQSVRGDRMAQYLNARGLGVLGTLDAIARETGATQSQIALAWCAAQPGVTAPIASARTLDQLEELLGAMELELSEDQIARLDAASRA